MGRDFIVLPAGQAGTRLSLQRCTCLLYTSEKVCEYLPFLPLFMLYLRYKQYIFNVFGHRPEREAHFDGD